MPASLLPLIPGLPLLGAALLVALNRRAGRLTAALIAALTVGGAAALSLWTLIDAGLEGGAVHFTAFTWIRGGRFAAEAGLSVDSLSGALLLAAMSVGLAAVVHAASYLDEAEDAAEVWRWFAAAGLTLGAAALTLTADNLLLLLAGWYGVGVGASLLVGFRGTRAGRRLASQRLFAVEQLSAALLLLGIGALFQVVGGLATVDFVTLREAASMDPALSDATPLVGLLFVGAAAARAAAVPLHGVAVAAAEGPPPTAALLQGVVSSLTSVYLLSRVASLLALTPAAAAPTALEEAFTLAVVAAGATTALLAGISACVQSDLRRALACLSLSHIGGALLLVAASPSAATGYVTLPIVALVALTLAGGAASHAQDYELDLRRMGGLRAYLPVTALTLAVGWAANLVAWSQLSGIALEGVLEGARPAAAAAGLAAVVAGGFSSTRVLLLMTAGRYRGERASPHEASLVMTLPAVAVGVAAVALAAPWLRALAAGGTPGRWPLLAAPALGALAALVIYGREREVVAPLAERGGLARAARRLWYADALLERLVIQPIRLLGEHALRPLIDEGLIGGGATLLARAVAGLGRLQDRLAASEGAALPVAVGLGALGVLLLSVMA